MNSAGRRTIAAALLISATMLPACSEGSVDLTRIPLKTLDGEPASLQQHSGEWVVVNFWASFCKPCVREMPELQKLHEEGVTVVGVNALDRTELALKLIAETGVTYRILLDERGDLMAAASITGLPATIVLDPEGNVRASKTGEVDLEGLLDLLERAGRPSGAG